MLVVPGRRRRDGELPEGPARAQHGVPTVATAAANAAAAAVTADDSDLYDQDQVQRWLQLRRRAAVATKDSTRSGGP